MGAKASTANNDEAHPHDITFSTGGATDIMASTGFNILRSFTNLNITDRQRDGHENNSVGNADSTNSQCDIGVLETDNNSSNVNSRPNIALSLAMGRVFAARSLPSHWPLNGSIKCPVCSKFVLPDDVEHHLVICLAKPRLTYNEDILTSSKGECVICLDDLQQGDSIARLPCLCVYHKSCIDQWFAVNQSCPEHPGI